MFDNWQNFTRLLRGSNTASDAVVTQWDMHTKQVSFPAYNSVSAFAGTAVANLAVDIGGNIITVSTSGGTVFPYTGIAHINGGLVVTGSITSSGPIHSLANGAMYFRGGDDAEFWDINVANTVGIYGQQDQTVASIKLGNNGGILSGRSGSIGIGTTLPVSGTLHVEGNVFAASLTGSLFGTASWATNFITSSVTSASYAFTASSAISSSFAGSAISSSYAFTASSAISSSFAGNTISSSYSFTASSAVSAFTASSSVSSSQAISASYAFTASSAISAFTASSAVSSSQAISASYAFTASSAVSAFTASSAVNATNALTASSADNFVVRQSITASNALINGTITAQTLVVQVITSSTDYVTGSTRFGSTTANTHQFTGSVTITGSFAVTGPATITNLTGSLFGSASQATSASYAFTASSAISSSYSFTASSAISSSYAFTASSAISAFTASSAISSSFATSASYAFTASSAISAFTASSAISSSRAISSSFAITASYYQLVTGSAGTDVNIVATPSGSIINIPDASTTARGLITTGAQNIAGAKTFTGAVIVSSISTSNVTSNFYVGSALGASTLSTAELLIGGATNITSRVNLGIGSSISSFGTQDVSYGAVIIGNSSYNTSATVGVHPIVSSLAVKPVIGNVNTGTIANSATVYIENTSSLAATNVYSLWVDSGTTRLDGNLIMSGSNIAATGSISATQGFTGSLFGTSSWAQNAISASYVTGSIFTSTNPALSSSYALTASYALNGGGGAGLTTKAGSVANTSFSGNPKKATVAFATAFGSTNYAITVTGEDARSWTIESKLAGSFVINANSNTNLSGTTYWTAIAYGES
jgi:hypothetical protein